MPRIPGVYFVWTPCVSAEFQRSECPKTRKIKKSGLATALSINYPLLLSLVRHNLLCHSETSYAELIFDMGYALETEVFGA